MWLTRDLRWIDSYWFSATRCSEDKSSQIRINSSVKST